MKNRPTALIILDGWGYREDKKDNAIAAARTPFFDSLWKKYPHTLLEASGLAVGLPHGQMGNSEIGHTTIGAGKIIDTDLVRVQKSIDSGHFGDIPAIRTLFDYVKNNNSTLHVQGLLSDGGVHSHQDHLFAFLREAKKAGIKKVAVHIFTDGRDTAPQSAHGFVEKLETLISELGNTHIASLSGRFYAMDRDNNWDRLAKVEDVLFNCTGNTCDIKTSDHIKSLYLEGKKDEHFEPTVIGTPTPIQKDDGVFFFNFRADRARMISQKIIDKKIFFVTLTEYHPEFKALVAFPSIKIETTLAKEISDAGYSQSHIAETEKFPHATYFLNGGVEKPHAGESHIMLDSRKDIKTHDLAPKMRAEGIADKAIEEIKKGVDFIFINFANPDMVGHTANVPAIIEAIEEVDTQLGRVITALDLEHGIAFITADHGNAEVNMDQDTPHTAHTINPVPAILTDTSYKLETGTLADIAPTILLLMGIDQSKHMTGHNIAHK